MDYWVSNQFRHVRQKEYINFTHNSRQKSAINHASGRTQPYVRVNGHIVPIKHDMNVRSEQYAILDRVDASSISRVDGNLFIILPAVTVSQRKDVGSFEAIPFAKISTGRLFPWPPLPP